MDKCFCGGKLLREDGLWCQECHSAYREPGVPRIHYCYPPSDEIRDEDNNLVVLLVHGKNLPVFVTNLTELIDHHRSGLKGEPDPFFPYRDNFLFTNIDDVSFVFLLWRGWRSPAISSFLLRGIHDPQAVARQWGHFSCKGKWPMGEHGKMTRHRFYYAVRKGTDISKALSEIKERKGRSYATHIFPFMFPRDAPKEELEGKSNAMQLLKQLAAMEALSVVVSYEDIDEEELGLRALPEPKPFCESQYFLAVPDVGK